MQYNAIQCNTANADLTNTLNGKGIQYNTIQYQYNTILLTQTIKCQHVAHTVFLLVPSC